MQVTLLVNVRPLLLARHRSPTGMQLVSKKIVTHAKQQAWYQHIMMDNICKQIGGIYQSRSRRSRSQAMPHHPPPAQKLEIQQPQAQQQHGRQLRSLGRKACIIWELLTTPSAATTQWHAAHNDCCSQLRRQGSRMLAPGTAGSPMKGSAGGGGG